MSMLSKISGNVTSLYRHWDVVAGRCRSGCLLPGLYIGVKNKFFGNVWSILFVKVSSKVCPNTDYQLLSLRQTDPYKQTNPWPLDNRPAQAFDL